MEHTLQCYTLTAHSGRYTLTPGVIDRNAKLCFTRGHCHSFALAVHKLTGWPLYGLQSAYLRAAGDTPYHVVVKMPDGDFMDIGGGAALERWEQHYIDHIPFPYTAKQVMNFCKADYKLHEVEAAMPFAQEVLKRCTHLPIQNRIPFPLHTPEVHVLKSLKRVPWAG